MKHLQSTAMQTQQQRPYVPAAQKHLINATKHLPNWHAAENEEKSQDKNCLLTEEVCKCVIKKYNANLHCKRIGNLVTKAFIGVTPPNQGVKGDIPTIVYKSIYQAFDSHIKINQYKKI